MSITCQDAVLALKQRGISTSAKEIAEMLKSDSRAVNTALREAVDDERVTIIYKRGIGYYRFKRLVAKTKGVPV